MSTGPDLTEADKAALYKARGFLKRRRFQEAHDGFAALYQTHPHTRSVAMGLAALKTRLGDPQAGRAVMRDFFRHVPVKHGPEARPAVLAVRGFENTLPKIGSSRRKGLHPKLQGGHFTLSTLLPRQAIARHVLTLTPGSTDWAEHLPPFDLILNTVSEPDVEPHALTTLSAYLAKHPEIPVINHPEAVLETTRDRNYRRLQGIDGLVFPATHRLRLENAGPQALYDALLKADLRAPIILRPVGSQTGRGVALLEGRDDLNHVAETPLTGEFYAIAFRKLMWRGTHYRKMRVFCIDGAFYPVVCYLDTHWNVHGARKKLMRESDELMEEEQRFLSDWQAYLGPRAVRALEAVARRTRMEFFGIDFTLDEEGNLFIFELNAAMRHHYGHLELFPYKEPHDRAITQAFQEMVRARLSKAAQV